MRVEARSGNEMALSTGRRERARPLGRRMESSDDLELTRVNMTPDSDNRDREPIDRAVTGNGMNESLPSIEPCLVRGLPGGRCPSSEQPAQPNCHDGCPADAVEVMSMRCRCRSW